MYCSQTDGLDLKDHVGLTSLPRFIYQRHWRDLSLEEKKFFTETYPIFVAHVKSCGFSVPQSTHPNECFHYFKYAMRRSLKKDRRWEQVKNAWSVMTAVHLLK